MKLFTTAFLQVFLVSANVFFIGKLNYPGILFCSFSISYLWTINVTRISISKKRDRIIYALGAMSGGVCGVYISSLIA